MILVHTTQVNSAFVAHRLASSEVLRQGLFTLEYQVACITLYITHFSVNCYKINIVVSWRYLFNLCGIYWNNNYYSPQHGWIVVPIYLQHYSPLPQWIIILIIIIICCFVPQCYDLTMFTISLFVWVGLYIGSWKSRETSSSGWK